MKEVVGRCEMRSEDVRREEEPVDRETVDHVVLSQTSGRVDRLPNLDIK